MGYAPKILPSNRYNLSGFTLVELIVVITILVILGTIAFISLGWFSGSARDSSRLSDLTSLSKGLDLYKARNTVYPTPDNAFTVSYSWGSLWSQGTVWDAAMGAILSVGGKMNKKPTDPLISGKEYTYSVLSQGNAYSLKADWEGELSSRSFPLMENAYAASGNPTIGYIKTNYNGVAAKTQTWGLIYIFALPSVISTQTGAAWSLIDVSSLANKLMIHGWTSSGGVTFTPKLVFTGASLPSNDFDRASLAASIASAYSGTLLTSNTNISPYIAVGNNTTTLASLGKSLIVGSLWGSSINTPYVAPAYSSSTTYGVGQMFAYGSATITVTGTGIGTASTKADPACDTNDIAIWQGGTNNVQVWSACNVGASVAVPYASSASVVTGDANPDATELSRIGNYFQWGNKGYVTDGSSVAAQVSTVGSIDSAWSTNVFRIGTGDWSSNQNDNLWGNTTNTLVARRWPCTEWYHVPTGGTQDTTTEWWATQAIVNANAQMGSCNQVVVLDRVRCALMLPLAGYRAYNSGWFAGQGSSTYYLSSTPTSSPYAYVAQFTVGGGSVAYGFGYRASGFPVRCIKN